MSILIERTIVPDTCSLMTIPNTILLRQRNLVLVDVHCKRIRSQSDRCLPKESYAKFSCQRGFIFENRIGLIFYFNKTINHHFDGLIK